MYTNIDQLLSDLYKDVQTYLKHEIIGMDIFSTKFKLNDKSMDEPGSSWIDLIDFWIHLPYPEHCLQRFVHILKNYYNGVDSKIKVLENFQRDYNGQNAIQWYIKRTQYSTNVSVRLFPSRYISTIERGTYENAIESHGNKINSFSRTNHIRQRVEVTKKSTCTLFICF